MNPSNKHLLPVLLLCVIPTIAFALSDEIQVYDATINPVGIYNLMLHNNYTPNGLKIPAFPGGLVSNHALVGVPEWSYGVNDWFEQGLYIPLYSLSENRGATLNGLKIRELFVIPHAAEQRFFYGVNFEFSLNAKQWDPVTFTSEIRTIFGWHLAAVDIIFNPILDTDFKGGIGNL